MTREEAIKRIELMTFITYTESETEKNNEAMKMVLKALRQKPCDACISRNDMLDAIGHGTTYTSEELQDIIKGLPPVQPYQKTGHWIEEENKIPYCSLCGAYSDDASRGIYFHGQSDDITDDAHYCPSCGAKME